MLTICIYIGIVNAVNIGYTSLITRFNFDVEYILFTLNAIDYIINLRLSRKPTEVKILNLE